MLFCCRAVFVELQWVRCWSGLEQISTNEQRKESLLDMLTEITIKQLCRIARAITKWCVYASEKGGAPSTQVLPKSSLLDPQLAEDTPLDNFVRLTEELGAGGGDAVAGHRYW